MEHQQGIRQRFSHMLASSIGMCRSKQAPEEPISVSRQKATMLPSRVRNPRLADLFSADSDTTPCEKFESDKTWSGSEADRASMSHLSPFDYETCDGEFDEDGKSQVGQLEDRKDKMTWFEEDYYYGKSCSCSSSSCRRMLQQQLGRSSDGGMSDSDMASLVLIELSQRRQVHKKNEASGRARGRRRGGERRRRKRRGSGDEVVVKGGGSVAVAKRSVDPYEDFKRSMVEMIVEKEMFGREDLEELLMSFLGLNSPDHHKLIVLVFVDILEILFSSHTTTTTTTTTS